MADTSRVTQAAVEVIANSNLIRTTQIAVEVIVDLAESSNPRRSIQVIN